MKFKKGQRVELLKAEGNIAARDQATVDGVFDDHIDLLLDKDKRILSVDQLAYKWIRIIDEDRSGQEKEFDPYEEIKKLKKIIKILLGE